ncbi:MAG: HD domain-containing protein [Dictyoglomus sp.]
MAVARIVDYRSKIQVIDSRNVANISAFLAGDLKINGEKIKKIRTSGYLHDIGKATLSSDILLKNEKLSKKDIEYIKYIPLNSKMTKGSMNQE